MSDGPGDSAAHGGPAAKWRILVVDDEEAVRSLAVACIRHALGEQHETLEAWDGEQAIAVAEREHPDLILLDILMPGVDGFEACRRMKASATTKDIPIVFLTALGAEKDMARGLAVGGDGYVTKPFNAVTLAAQISELLSPPSEGTA
jgi:two-component system cell cycle response regulator